MTVQRSDVVYLAWSVNRGRVLELGGLLGAQPFLLYPTWLRGRSVTPVRYLLSGVWTVLALALRRPRVVLVINPPVLAAGCAVLYGRLSGARVVVDSHPGGFGAQGDSLSARLQPLHRWAVRRAAATLVTGEHWAGVVRGWGGRPLVVHEPPGAWTEEGGDAPAAVEGRQPDRVLFLGTYGRDEPVAELVAAARALPDVRVRVTGDPAAAPAGLLERRPANVEPLGYLAADAYQREVRNADLVVVLTTEPTSVMRAAYEAVYARRPLVVSDWPALREVFPYAVHVPNTPEGIARGVRRALDDLPALSAAAEPARQLQVQRWKTQLAALRQVVG